MDTTTRADLRDVLLRHRDDAVADGGLDELVAVAVRNPAERHRYLDALAAALADVADPDVLELARERWPAIRDADDAAVELRGLAAALEQGVFAAGPAPAGWLERRADVLRALAELDAERRRAENAGASTAQLVPLRRRAVDLRQAYADDLPATVIARDPLGGEVLAVRLDAAGLDGPYWDALTPARPFEPLAAGYVVHAGAMALDPHALDDTLHLCAPGPGVPFVTPALLERDGVHACLSTLPVGPHLGYVTTYFSARTSEPPPLPNEWGVNTYWLRDAGRPTVLGEAYDDRPAPDFDLAPWVASGKLAWVLPGDPAWQLRHGVTGCPYLDLPGTREHQRRQLGRLW